MNSFHHIIHDPAQLKEYTSSLILKFSLDAHMMWKKDDVSSFSWIYNNIKLKNLKLIRKNKFSPH